MSEMQQDTVAVTSKIFIFHLNCLKWDLLQAECHSCCLRLWIHTWFLQNI